MAKLLVSLFISVAVQGVASEICYSNLYPFGSSCPHGCCSGESPPCCSAPIYTQRRFLYPVIGTSVSITITVIVLVILAICRRRRTAQGPHFVILPPQQTLTTNTRTDSHGGYCNPSYPFPSTYATQPPSGATSQNGAQTQGFGDGGLPPKC